MRIILFSIMSLLCFANSSYAKGPVEWAEYIVPTPPELVQYSRFLVKINAPYRGQGTQEISYTFPEELTGVADQAIVLQPSPTQPNFWESPEMTASCTILDDIFSCNMYLKKSTAVSPLFATSSTLFDKNRAREFLKNKGLSAEEFEKRSAVLDHFHGGEPAGILTYEFTVY